MDLSKTRHDPRLVALVGAVGRAFYRDEAAAVLDGLAANLLVREDDFEAVFGLSPKQVRTVVAELAAERLVAAEPITQYKGKGKRAK